MDTAKHFHVLFLSLAEQKQDTNTDWHDILSDKYLLWWWYIVNDDCFVFANACIT